MNRLLRLRAHLPEIAVLAAAAALYLVGLGGDAMRDWDEATYAAVAREMLATGDWLTPQLDGLPFYDKPPLVLCLMASAQALSCDCELAARLPIALLGVFGIAATYLLGRRLAGRGAGLLAAAILAPSPQWLRFSRQAMLDVPLATALAFSFLGALTANWVLLGGALGAALMIKGPAALLALPPLAIWAARDHRHLATAWRGGALGLGIAAPWHLWQLLVHGAAFARPYFGLNVAARLGSAVEGNSGPWWYYLEYVFFHWVNPWHWLGAAAVLTFTATTLRRPRDADRALVAAWFWTVLLAFSLASTKLHWYVMPIYPALAVITAVSVVQAPWATRRRQVAAAALCTATLMFAVAEVGLHRLRNRASESTRQVLLTLPGPSAAPALLVAAPLPLGTARYYARREVGRWVPAAPLPDAVWVLGRPEDVGTARGMRVAASDGQRTLLHTP
jgi:4-amino-4-deoxy-L-arabinose transferase-like glycosyltransferase